MGNPKQKWTSEEEEALRAGVAKHGAGKWKNIQRDPEFNHVLYSRSNIDLKDKWRNLGVANGQVTREQSRTPKPKANPAETFDTPQTVTPSPALASFTPSSQDQDAVIDVVMAETARPLPEANNAPKYNSMIFEALSTLGQPNGSDSGAIANFIERRQEVPQNFRRALSSRLRRLVQQDKLEKVQNCYKMKTDAVVNTNTPVAPVSRPKELQVLPRLVHATGIPGDTVEEASISAAFKVAEAEDKELVAAESVKEAERVATMAEATQSFLQFATECFNQSAYGEIMLMA